MVGSEYKGKDGLYRFLLLFVLILLLLVLRRPDAVTNPQFWAEDGTLFFSSQLNHPGLGVIFETHKGYLLLIPRLVSAFAAVFASSRFPLILNLCALALAAVCCSLFSLNRYRYLLRSDQLRILLCLLAATAFHSDELIGTITNIQTFLLLGILLILLQPAEVYKARATAFLSISAALLGCLSAPATLLFIPLAVYLTLRRQGIATLVPVAVMLAVAIQIGFYTAIGDPYRTPPDHLNDILSASLITIAYRVVLTPLLGLPAAKSLATTDFTLALLLTIPTMGVWLTALWLTASDAQRAKVAVLGADTAKRWKMAISVYLIFASVALAIGGRSMVKLFSYPIIEWRAERYFFLGCCVFAYLIALSLECWLPYRRAQVIVLAAIFVPGLYANFRTIPFTDYYWQQYATEVDAWRHGKSTGRAVAALTIPINPAPLRVELPGLSPAMVFEGALLRRPGHSPELDKVYVVLHGRKHWVTSMSWFAGHGYKWPGDLHMVSAEVLETIPLGPPIE